MQTLRFQQQNPDPPLVPDSAIADRESKIQRAKLVGRLVQEAGGDRYRDYRFSNWSPPTELAGRVKSAAQEWAMTFPDRLKAREALVFYGPVGAGKDHLIFAATRQAVLQHGAKASWRNGRDLMGEVRDRIGENINERRLIAELEYPQLLVIADPLPVRGDLTPHQADTLYRIVENRYAAGLLTCVMLNVESDAEADERLGAATWDRLCHNSWKCHCNWESYRRPARVVE